MEKRGTTPGSTITIMVNLKSLDLSVKWKENIISVALKWEHRNKIKTCMLKNPVEWFKNLLTVATLIPVSLLFLGYKIDKGHM